MSELEGRGFSEASCALCVVCRGSLGRRVMKRFVTPLLCLLMLASVGCSDDGPADTTSPSGGTTGDPNADGPLTAPVLEAVIPMSKVLRVRWSTPTRCDDVDGERRTDAVTFAPAFSVPGTDTDFVDEEANQDQAYTYRVRCVRGDSASEWSNMLSANPFLE